MKKCIWCLTLILSFLLTLGGCRRGEKGADPSSETKEGQKEKNYEDFFSFSQTEGGFLEAPKGYYVVDQSTSGEYFLYYTDKDKIRWVKLCSRPDCGHNSEDCNAYVGFSGNIGFYDNHIYYTCMALGGNKELQEDIWRMDLDGGNHEKVKALPLYENSNNFNYRGVFHAGYFLYFVSTKTEEGAVQELRALPLDKGKQDYIVMKEVPADVIGSFYAKGNDVYMYMDYRTDKVLEHYKLEQGTWNTVEGNWAGLGSLAIGENSLMAAGRFCGGFHMDLSTHETKIDVELDSVDNEIIYTDGEYYYVGNLNEFLEKPDGERKISIFNKIGEPVAEGELPKKADLYYYCATNDYIFFYEGE